MWMRSQKRLLGPPNQGCYGGLVVLAAWTLKAPSCLALSYNMGVNNIKAYLTYKLIQHFLTLDFS